MSFGSQSGATSNVPSWAIPYEKSILPIASQALEQSQSQQNLSSGPTAQATKYLSGVVAGDQLSPTSDPYLAQQAQVMQQQGLGATQNAINAAGQGSQGSGMLLSSAANAAKNNAAVAGAQNTSNNITNMYANNYQQGLQRQMQAVNPLIQQDPYSKAMALAQMFAGGNMGGTSSGTSMGISIL